MVFLFLSLAAGLVKYQFLKNDHKYDLVCSDFGTMYMGLEYPIYCGSLFHCDFLFKSTLNILCEEVFYLIGISAVYSIDSHLKFSPCTLKLVLYWN